MELVDDRELNNITLTKINIDVEDGILIILYIKITLIIIWNIKLII